MISIFEEYKLKKREETLNWVIDLTDIELIMHLDSRIKTTTCTILVIYDEQCR